MADSLLEALDQYEPGPLQEILNFQGYKVQGKGRLSKPELTRLLVTIFTEPGRIAKVYAGLSHVEREVLVALQRQGGTATRGAIRRRLRDLSLLDTRETRLDVYSSQQPDFRRTDSRYLDEILAHLLACGLVFGRQTPDAWGRMTNLTFRLVLEYFIPLPILGLLPAPPELPAELPALEAPVKVQESSARVFQRDLFLYWSYVYRNQPDLIAKGLLAKRHLTAVNETLLQRETIGTGQGEADFPRLMFLRAMLTQLGLVELLNGTLHAKPGEEFFGADPLERIRRAFDAYITGRQLNELTWQHSITTYGEHLTPVPDRLVDARKMLALYFRLSTGWTALGVLIDRVRETQYEFLLPRSFRTPTTQSYFYSTVHPYTQYGNPLGWEWPFPPGMDESDGWQRVEGQLIAWVVGSAFYWMGLVDLGLHGPKVSEPDCFRLTAPGRWLLAGGAPPEIPQGGGQVIAQPDFTILAFDPISDAVLFRLDQFARRVSAERAILFRLTQQSVYAAQQTGWDVARIRAYLEELGHLPLPANVTRTLEEWQAAHERIRILPHVNLLHAPRAEDLDELAGQARVKALLARRPAPGVAVLPGGKKLVEVSRLLADQGWWPVVTPKSAGLPPRSVAVDQDGRLSFLQRTPGLYLRAHLARFAEPEQQAYRLTPASIRRAAVAGLEAPQMVAELNRVLDRPLPPVLEQRVLAWSGHFGTLQAEEMTLLRFKNESALSHLLADPELIGLLRTLRREDLDHIALVRAKDAEKLRRLLEERGVEWKE